MPRIGETITFCCCALAAAVGDSVRNQRESVASALARAEAAEASREEEARRRVQELTIAHAAEHLTPEEIDDVLLMTRKRDEAKALEEIAWEHLAG